MDKTNGKVEAREGCGFGWGCGERQGENADNCNWITIKEFMKQEIIVKAK